MSLVNSVRETNGQEHLTIDGKTLRRSHNRDKITALHLLSVMAFDCGLVVYQSRSSGNKNEIKSVQEILDLFEIEDACITLDAMHCQVDTVATLRKKKADYVIQVKNNQKRLYEEIQAFFHKTQRETNFHVFMLLSVQPNYDKNLCHNGSKIANQTKPPAILCSSTWVRAPLSGILRAQVSLGDLISKGDVLGFISVPACKKDTVVEATSNGIIIGRSNIPLVYEGEALFHIGRSQQTSLMEEHFDPLQDKDVLATPELVEEPVIV